MRPSRPYTRITATLAFLVLIVATSVMAQFGSEGVGYDLSWNTVDGGGGTSTGGAFSLDGTIGQHDAGSMGGGGYTLDGGFWPGSNSAINTCPADINHDNVVNVVDVLAAIANYGALGATAEDVNGDLVVNILDILAIISAWGACP